MCKCKGGTCKCFTKFWLTESCNPAFGLLLIRLALASVFLFHGIQKLSNMEGTIGFFAMMGLGAFFAWLVAILEVVAGAMMLAGLWTHVAGIILATIMFFAIVLVKGKNGMGFGAFEFDFVLMLVAFGVAMTGPGDMAVHCGCQSCGCKDGKCDGGKAVCDGCDGCKSACTGHEGK